MIKLSQIEKDVVRELAEIAKGTGYLLRRNMQLDAAMTGRDYQLIEIGSGKVVVECRLERMSRIIYDLSPGRNAPFPKLSDAG